MPEDRDKIKILAEAFCKERERVRVKWRVYGKR
jgi:hypothetical protein